VIGPDDDGTYSVHMQQFRESSGSAAKGTAPQTDGQQSIVDALHGMTVAVSTISLDFRIEDLVKSARTARRDNEKLIFDLIGKAPGTGQAADRSVLRRFGEVLARALLCPVAALLAVAAAASSVSPMGRFLALPVAAVVLLLCDVFGGTALGDAAQQGGPALWGTLAAACLIGLGLPLAYILKRGEIIVAPGRSRG
jgi:lipopolysaccharide export LptBFGC system permease protein LptF